MITLTSCMAPQVRQHCAFSTRSGYAPQRQRRQAAICPRRLEDDAKSIGSSSRKSLQVVRADNGAATATVAPPTAVDSPLVYSGIIFDMDGTLTQSNIDFVTMREKTGIPIGDLFTVMESWDDGDRIKRSMDTILELEADAAASLQPMLGLLDLLAFLRGSGVRVGIVTRNTTEAVNAFFATIGEEWRSVFDVVLTRDNTPHVKPDKRALLHFAEVWGMQPWELLMVGDSTEDIETGNAAGTASCLIAGGGNEVAAAATAAPPPRGAVPTFTVESLVDLQRRLQERSTALGWGAATAGAPSLASSSSDSDGEAPGAATLAGAPPEGLDFLDALFALGAVQAASCSFPRVDGSRFGVPPDAHPGHRVLHLACGNGALTKMLFSSGLQVIGVDEDVAEAQRRGLPAVALSPLVLGAGALQPELAAMGAAFDAAVFYQPSSSDSGSGLAGSLWQQDSLAELQRVLKPGGKLCVQAPVADEAAVKEALELAGFSVAVWEQAQCGSARFVASAPTS